MWKAGRNPRRMRTNCPRGPCGRPVEIGATYGPTAQACAARTRQQHFLRHDCSRLGGLVEIGEPERTYTVEPVEDPVPREAPTEPAEPDRPSPAEPVEPEKVPAP
jgi:hypothetical protein